MKLTIVMMTSAITLAVLALTGCGSTDIRTVLNNPIDLEPVGVPSADGGVVHGRAIYTVTNVQQTAMIKLFHQLIMPYSYAATGSTTVTYTNAASTNFTINVGSFTAGGFTGEVLSLGSVSLATINDNNLKVCGVGGNTKCTSAVIRVYTTGSIAGFVNTDDAYGAPVFTGTLNPNTALGLNAAGSVPVQTLSIPANKNKVRLSDFPSPTYAVTSDFSNAGAGSYSMTYVVEYVLF